MKLKPGDRVVMDAWLNPAEAVRCHYPADFRIRGVLGDRGVRVIFGVDAVLITTSSGALLWAPVSCVVPEAKYDKAIREAAGA